MSDLGHNIIMAIELESKIEGLLFYNPTQPTVIINSFNKLPVQDIQSLCKPEQIKAFDALLLEMSDLFSPRKKPRR